VDRLHARAGSRRVVELHGALEDVVCIACGALDHRDSVQARLADKNSHFVDPALATAPDGDADLAPEAVARFELVGCVKCGGALRPRVVFFGENVAREIVDEAMSMVDGARRLLVVGTSLAVFSGYRFLRRAAERGVPIAIVNRGPVRGEELAAMKVEASAGQVLRALERRLIELA
jgi:NAD-dependent SIR2 family protein deacetylase